MKLVPLDSQFGKLFVRHLEASFIGILVQSGSNVEPCFGSRAADQIDHDLATDQRTSAPVVGDVAEHSMFDLVPLAGSGWKVTDVDLDADFISQLLHLAFPQADPISVAAATIRRNQQAPGMGIAGMAHFFPPAPDAFGGEFSSVVIDPNTYPTLIGCDIVDAVGCDLAEFRINEIIDANFLGLALWLPFLAAVLEIADQFLLLGVCALRRCTGSVGANPTRQLSLQPEAPGADQEVTNGLKHLGKRPSRGPAGHAGRSASEHRAGLESVRCGSRPTS